MGTAPPDATHIGTGHNDRPAGRADHSRSRVCAIRPRRIAAIDANRPRWSAPAPATQAPRATASASRGLQSHDPTPPHKIGKGAWWEKVGRTCRSWGFDRTEKKK